MVPYLLRYSDAATTSGLNRPSRGNGSVDLLEALSPLGHHLANPPAADDGQRLALELLPHELFPLPLALLHGNVCLRDSPGIEKTAVERGEHTRKNDVLNSHLTECVRNHTHRCIRAPGRQSLTLESW